MLEIKNQFYIAKKSVDLQKYKKYWGTTLDLKHCKSASQRTIKEIPFIK